MVKHFLLILVQNENSVQMNAILKVYLNVKLKLVLYVENNFEQYTNTKAESLFTVQKNVGSKGQQKKKNALYAVKGLRHSKAEIKNISKQMILIEKYM